MLKINSFKKTLLFFLLLLPFQITIGFLAPEDIPAGMTDALKTGNSLLWSAVYNN
jgi:hypothetical protein